MYRQTLMLWVITLLSATVWSDPVVRNPSFEADVYATWPGYARQHGERITGWSFTGGVGINPIRGAKRKTGDGEDSAFFDNGKTPHGNQICFMQNASVLRQSIRGFEAGETYRVMYFENARHNHAPERNPTLKVTLGDQLVVSEHAIRPIEDFGSHELPFCRVESAPFTAPRDGAFELVFEATANNRVAVLLDHIQIVRIE